MALIFSVIRDLEGKFQIDACKFEVTKRWGFGGVKVSIWVVKNWMKVKSSIKLNFLLKTLPPTHFRIFRKKKKKKNKKIVMEDSRTHEV